MKYNKSFKKQNNNNNKTIKLPLSYLWSVHREAKKERKKKGLKESEKYSIECNVDSFHHIYFTNS